MEVWKEGRKEKKLRRKEERNFGRKEVWKCLWEFERKEVWRFGRKFESKDGSLEGTREGRTGFTRKRAKVIFLFSINLKWKQL